jgi:calcium permeable stress-gated cation channel
VELKTQSWYFIFQVIQVFLITTFTSGAASVASQIAQNPTLAVSLLAKNLPKASNFYISYFIVLGLMQAALLMLNLVPFLMIALLGRFLDKTPRKLYNRWMNLSGLGWGSVYPKFTNLGVIALSYSCIAPLVLGFATVGFALLYLGFRYNFLYVLGIKVDMKGESYCRALQQLLTGVYLATLCLIGLFAIGAANSPSGAGPLVLMILFLVVLIVYHVLINQALGPLEQNLPLDLLAENEESVMVALQVEEARDEKLHESNTTTTTTTTTTTATNINTNIHTSQHTDNSAHLKNGINSHDTTQEPKEPTRWHSTSTPTTPGRKQNFLTRKIKPLVYKFYLHCQTLLRRSPSNHLNAAIPRYSVEDMHNAYSHPSLSSETQKMVVWLPRDRMGLSRVLLQENREAGIEGTDEHAWLNEKGKVEWDWERPGQVPVWREKRVW